MRRRGAHLFWVGSLFKMKKIFIIKFQNRQGTKYIYDVCSNLFFRFSKKIEKFLSESQRKKDEISKLEPYSSLINQYGCLFHDFIRSENEPLTKIAVEQTLSNINSLILEITQNCNFRCRYCVYGGTYLYYRHHNKKTMTYEIAKKSIDYFENLINSPKRTKIIKEKYISFYGGEPLLEFKLVKKCIEYINSGLRNRISDNLKISISTNGYLLNPEIIEYCVQNNISLHISLDGPQYIHDKNRVLKNGRGTFEKIFKNIRYIKEKYPDYYSSYITFLITFSKEYNLMEIDSFFNNTEYFNKKNLFFNGVNPYDTSFYKGKNVLKENQLYIKKLYSIYENALCTNRLQEISPINFLLFMDKFRKFTRSGYSLLKRKPIFSATCVPGKKIFVSSDGNFHVCEKINHKFSIGDCQKGIDFEKVRKMWEDFNSQVVKERCNKCFAVHYCDVCFATVAKDGYFDADKDRICKKRRQNLLKDFRDYFSVLERNPQAFQYFENE